MFMKKLLSDLPILGLGVGLALTGASTVAIGAQGVKKDLYISALLMGGGVWLARTGSQVALGAVERMRGAQ